MSIIKASEGFSLHTVRFGPFSAKIVTRTKNLET